MQGPTYGCYWSASGLGCVPAFLVAGMGHHRNGASRPLGETGLVGGFQNGAFQHLPGRLRSPKWPLSTSASPEWALVASFLTRQLFKTSKGSDPAPFIWQPLLCILERVRFCVCPLKSRVSVFCSPLGFQMQVSLAFKTRRVLFKAWGPLPHAVPPVWGAQYGTWAPHLGRIPAVRIIILFVGHHTNRCGSHLYCVSTLPPIPVGFLLFFPFLLNFMVCGILVPWPRIKPMAPAVEAQSFNHWTTRKSP